MKKIPDRRTAAHKLLRTLLTGSGTFYQICERADFSIETDRSERIMRDLFRQLLDGGHVAISGMIYSITTAARNEIDPPAPYVGKVAGPALRATAGHAPVKIARCAGGVRS